MPEWLSDTVTTSASLPIQQVLLRLVSAILLGAGVAGIFRLSHGRDKEDASTLTATLVLLSVLIAMVSMVIGDSVARAFSLVGALSIVRFRTVVEDTRDTAFVIFAVIVGMAAGAGVLLAPLLSLPLVGAVAIALSRANRGSANGALSESTLTIRLGLGRDPETVLGGVLSRRLESYRLQSVATARQGAALDLQYHIRLRSSADMAVLVAELNQVEGVQSVEIRQEKS